MPSNQPIALPPLRRLHLFALLAAFVLAGLGLAACGSDSGGNEDAQQVINETFNGKKKVESGKINMSVTAKLEATGAAAAGLKDPVSLKLSGPFQSRGQDKLPAVDLDLSVAGGGQTFTAGAVTTGDAAFISYQGTDYAVPASQFRRYKRQVERDARNNSNNDNQFDLAQLGVNPRNWIENPKNEGTEDVGGAEAIHVSADVNVSKFVDDVDNLLKKASELGIDNQQQVPTKLTDRQKKQIEDSIQDVRFDLFTGKDDKVLRRIEVEFGFELPKSLSTQAQGVKSGTVKLALEIADLNEDQQITAPKDARPLSELQNQLGLLGGLGGTGGSGSSGSGSSSGGSSGSGSSGGSSSGGGSGAGGSDLGTGGGSGSGASSKRSQKYLDCLSKAKQPADIEKCAKILEG